MLCQLHPSSTASRYCPIRRKAKVRRYDGSKEIHMNSSSTDGAELLDASGAPVSTGRAVELDKPILFKFYPHDSTPVDKITGSAKILFLKEANRRLKISAIERCQAETVHELHFHVRVE